MILIGIDPGVHTGVAASDKSGLQVVATMSAVEAEQFVHMRAAQTGWQIAVFFEDARLRNWFGSKGREALQGAGSIKRDCQRWEEWLIHHGISFSKIAPQANRTKLSADQFKKITGWQGRTNEHGRDAAMLIFGRKQ